jgi:hypothetical protein
MKDAEKKYCRDRVKAALAIKLDSLKKAHMSKPTGLSDKAKLELIRAQEVPLKRGARLDWTLDQAFDFSYQEKHNDPALNADTYNPAAAELKKQADQVVDEIMVGDPSAAVKAMREFCA